MANFTPTEYLRAAAETLARSSNALDLRAIWTIATDAVLPTLSPTDRCEAIMGMNIETGCSQQSAANQQKVKPTGDVQFTLAFMFGDRLVFVAMSGVLRVKYSLTTVRYEDVTAVHPVEYRYKMNTMPGFEILTRAGRIAAIGNDPVKYDAELLQRWNRRMMKRLAGEWVARWMDDEPKVKEWGVPETT